METLSFQRGSAMKLMLWAAFALIALFVFSPHSLAANKYWRGAATGSDHWELNTNWSNTPRGPSCACTPAATDMAIFSFSGSTARIRSTVNVRGILLSNVFTGSLIQGSGALTVNSGGAGLRIGSGTFVGGAAALAIDDLTQTGGKIRNVQGNFTLTGSLSIKTTAPTLSKSGFNMTGGTLIFGGKANQAFTVFSSNVTTNFYGMTLLNTASAGSNVVTVSGSNLLLHSNLALTTGQLDMEYNTRNLTVSGSIALANTTGVKLISLSTIAASGSVTTAGTSGVFNISGATLRLNGNSQTVTLGDALITNLTLEGGTATLGSDVRVSGTVTVGASSTLALSSSVLSATGSTITNTGTINEGTGFIHHTSSVDSTAAVNIGNAITFTMTDTDENNNGAGVETVTIAVTNGADDAAETLTLTETAVDSGIFRGTMPTEHGTPVNGDGKINSKAFASFAVIGTFTDAQDSVDVTNDSTTVTDSGVSTTSTGSGGSGSGGGGGGGGRSSTVSSSSATTTTGNDTSSGEPSNPVHMSEDHVTVEINGQSVTFVDVPVNVWFAAAVQQLLELGIASGYKDAAGNLTGEFGPANPVTYAEIAKLALVTAGHAESEGVGTPANKSARGHWAEKFIKLAEDLHLSVYGPSLDINKQATRGAVIQTILEAMGTPLDTEISTDFHDLSSNHKYARAISTAARLGIITGDTDENGQPKGTVRPDDSINRAETAKVLIKAMDMMHM